MNSNIPIIRKHDRFWVVRDDLYPGGTKQIVLQNALPELNAKHFVYVASVFGKGGAALAHACAALGYKATLIMSEHKEMPSWVEEASAVGAEILLSPPRPVTIIEPHAREYAHDEGAYYIEQGFAFSEFVNHLAAYAKKLPMNPAEIWCPVVSGTLAQGLEIAFPKAAMNCVAVVKHHDYDGRGTVYEAPEKFVRGAAIPPPYPSWTYSDAKVWRFAKKHGAEDAVIWNTNA